MRAVHSTVSLCHGIQNSMEAILAGHPSVCECVRVWECCVRGRVCVFSCVRNTGRPTSTFSRSHVLSGTVKGREWAHGDEIVKLNPSALLPCQDHVEVNVPGKGQSIFFQGFLMVSAGREKVVRVLGKATERFPFNVRQRHQRWARRFRALELSFLSFLSWRHHPRLRELEREETSCPWPSRPRDRCAQDACMHIVCAHACCNWLDGLTELTSQSSVTRQRSRDGCLIGFNKKARLLAIIALYSRPSFDSL